MNFQSVLIIQSSSHSMLCVLWQIGMRLVTAPWSVMSSARQLMDAFVYVCLEHCALLVH